MPLSDLQRVDVQQRLEGDFNLCFPADEFSPSLIATIIQHIILVLDDNAEAANNCLQDLEHGYYELRPNEFKELLDDIQSLFLHEGPLYVDDYVNNESFKNKGLVIDEDELSSDILAAMRLQLSIMLKKSHGYFQQSDHNAPIKGAIVDTDKTIYLEQFDKQQQESAYMTHARAFTFFGHTVSKKETKLALTAVAVGAIGYAMFKSNES